jgi:hypothetical protein
MNIATAAIDEEMLARHSNRVAEPIRRRESISLLPSLEPIAEVEEEEDGEEEPQMGAMMRNITLTASSPIQQLGPPKPQKKKRYVWYCCQCGDGPNEVHYVGACLECYHPRCGGCSVKATK